MSAIDQIWGAIKAWLKPGRLIPVIIISIGAITTARGLLGEEISGDEVRNVVLGLLTLLAVDALNERIGILAGIENQLRYLRQNSPLKSRDEFEPFRSRSARASDMKLLGVSFINLIPENLNYLEEKIRLGTTVRIIMLHPHSEALKFWNEAHDYGTAENDIERTLQALKTINNKQKNHQGKLYVRLSKNFAPFGLTIFDSTRRSGYMDVEFHSYTPLFEDRPHVSLTKKDDPDWFDVYMRQFEAMWDASEEWDADKHYSFERVRTG